MSNQKFTLLQDTDYNEEHSFEPTQMFGSNYNPNAQNTQQPTKIDFEDFNLGNEPAFNAPASAPISPMISPNIQPKEPVNHPFVDAQNNVRESLIGGPQGLPKPESNARVWQVDYYKFMFDVDTRQVFNRIIRSLIPFPPDYFDVISPNPDLYGPFWIASTLIFILSAVGNVSGWIDAARNGKTEEWKYDVNKLSFGAAAIYGYLGLIPLALFGVCKYFKIPLRLIQVLCIYGYSFFIFIPISFLCLIPNPIIRWILVGFATLLSTTLLIFNFFPIFRPHMSRGFIILIVMALFQIGFGLTCRLYFFKYKL